MTDATEPQPTEHNAAEKPTEVAKGGHSADENVGSNGGAPDTGSNSGTSTSWHEALGITAKGTCSRHSNCPVWIASSNTVMSCRICFSEEKSVGIRQRQTFAAVVQELQTSGSSKSLNSDADSASAPPPFPAAALLQNPGSLESMLKRLGQVQNWVLRQKEKEVHSLQLQIHKLEQRLADSEQTSQEQKQTIRALRRTIQQDLKLIKTMATQKQLELEAEAEFEAQIMAQEAQEAEEQAAAVQEEANESTAMETIEQPSPTVTTTRTAQARKLQAKAALMSGGSNNDDDGTPSSSPIKSSSASSSVQPYRSPPKRTVTPMPSSGRGTPGSGGSNSNRPSPVKDPRMAKQMQFFQRASRARGDLSGGARMNSTRRLMMLSSRSIDEGIPEESPAKQDSDIVIERNSASSYWNDADMSLASNPSKLFASFRGGLLDIPKSPPPPTHDATRQNRKLQLDVKDMSALQMPVRGVLSRNNSADPTDFPLMINPPPLRGGRKKNKAKVNAAAFLGATGIAAPDSVGGASSSTSSSSSKAATKEIPIDLLAQSLTALPLSRKLDHQSPEQFFTEKVPASATLPSMTPLGGESAASASITNAKQPQRTPSGLPKSPVVTKSPAKNATAPVRVPSIVPPPLMGPNSAHSTMTSDTGPTFAEGATVAMMEHNAKTAAAASSKPSLAQQLASVGGNSKPNFIRASSASGDTFVTGLTGPTFFDEASGTVGETSGTIGTISEGGGAPKGEGTDKFLFPVTGAKCHDKYGDTGDYTGTILVTEGLPHGSGCMNYESGRVYTGDWVSGQWNGKGKLLNPNGDTYEGEFVFDARHGKGVYKWDNGDVYTGMFREDKRHGQGKFCFHNGNVYEGEFCDGMFDGYGRYKFEGGYYEGEWKEGKYDGNGELMYANGGKYTGEFRNSVAHGFGMEVTADGQKRRGVWEHGQPVE